MNIAPIIAGKQKQILRRFRAGGATSADRARSPEELGCRISIVFRGLVRRGLLVETSEGRYYLDSQRTDEFLERRRKGVLFALLLTLVIVLVLLATR